MEKQDLKTLVKKYLSYLLYWYKYEGKFDPSIPEKYAKMIGDTEERLTRAGVTKEQVGKIIEYAKQYHELKQHEVTEGMLSYIRQRIFPNR